MHRSRPHRPCAVAAALLALAVLGACAPPSTTARTQTQTVVDMTGPLTTMATVTSTTESRLDTLPVAQPHALESVTEAYLALGLTPNLLDNARGIVGVRNVRLSRQLQGVPLTAYLECGTDNLGMPLAGNNRIEVTMTTEVRPAGGQSLLSTSLEARALRTSSGAQMDPLPCTSRGALEEKLLQTVRSRATVAR